MLTNVWFINLPKQEQVIKVCNVILNWDLNPGGLGGKPYSFNCGHYNKKFWRSVIQNLKYSTL